MKNVKYTSLGELSLELGINKSKLAYYYTMGLIEPVTIVGRMNIFDHKETVKKVKNIEKLKEKYTLTQIRKIIK